MPFDKPPPLKTIKQRGDAAAGETQALLKASRRLRVIAHLSVQTTPVIAAQFLAFTNDCIKVIQSRLKRAHRVNKLKFERFGHDGESASSFLANKPGEARSGPDQTS